MRSLETVAALQRFENRPPNQGFTVGQQHIVRRKEECDNNQFGSALSSADPMQVIAKIVSRIDTVRCRNWPRRLILHIDALWAYSLASSGACDGV